MEATLCDGVTQLTDLLKHMEVLQSADGRLVEETCLKRRTIHLDFSQKDVSFY